MRRLLIACLAIIAATGWKTRAIASILLLFGGGSGVIIHNLITPTIVPQFSASFDTNLVYGAGAVPLLMNGNTSPGPMELPTTPANSMFITVEGTVDPQIQYYDSNQEYALKDLFYVSEPSTGQLGVFNQTASSGFNWYLGLTGLYPVSTGLITFTHGANYVPGIFAGTFTGGGCVREPQAMWPSSGDAAVLDPGFGCNTAPTLVPDTIPGMGQIQATGAGSIASTCVSSAPVSGEQTVTVHVAIPHGIQPGMSYNITGITPFQTASATYIALAGSTGTTLVGETVGTCSGGNTATVEGTAGAGAGDTLNLSEFSLAPFINAGSGIQAPPGQRFCAIIGEYGLDSPTPGVQFVHMIDPQTGLPLPGSPAVPPYVNQGSAIFTGYTTTTIQDTKITLTASFSGTSMIVTAGGAGLASGMVISGPSMSASADNTIVSGPGGGGTGTYVMTNSITLPSSASYIAHTFVPALNVTAMSPMTITAASWSSANGGTIQLTTSVAHTLSPGSIITASSFAGGGWSALNGQTFIANGLGSGTSGSTITAVLYPVAALANPGGTYTASTGRMTSVIQAGMEVVGMTGSAVISPYGSYDSTGTGGTGSYGLTATQTGALGSSGSPISMTAFSPYYYSNLTTARTQASFGDLTNIIGAQHTFAPSLQSQNGWGGVLANVGMHWGVFPQDSSGNPSTAALASICQKTTDIQAFDTTNSITTRSLYRLNDFGEWGDSSNATITGYIVGSTLNVVGSPIFGSLVGSGTAYLGAPGIAGGPALPASITLTGTAQSTYTVTWGAGVTPANLGSSGSPVNISVGQWKPATPTTQAAMMGYISGNTLNVTGLNTTTGSLYATFTGTLGQVLQYGQQMTVSGTTGTLGTGMWISDGGTFMNGPPVSITVNSSPPVLNLNYYQFTGPDSTMFATYSYLTLGQMVYPTYGSGCTAASPVMIIGYGTGTGTTGSYTLSSSADSGCGSLGTPVALSMSDVTSGGAPAPGPALTITDPNGTGTMYAINNAPCSVCTGTIPLSGTYATTFLGGAPSAIQAQISTIPGGAPISGFAWANLDVTCAGCGVAGGAWSGNIDHVPAGGPYWISVRAANGTGYVTMPSYSKVGLSVALDGGAIINDIASTGSGENQSPWLTGLSMAPLQNTDAPPLVYGPAFSTTNAMKPAIQQAMANSTFAQVANPTVPMSESMQDMSQTWIANANGIPFGYAYLTNNSSSMGAALETNGYQPQTKTLGVGNGTITTFCSSANYCTGADATNANGKMTFNGAGMTGATFQGQITGAVLTINSISLGAMMPGLIISDGGNNITSTVTTLNCITNCTYTTTGAGAGSTWALSSSFSPPISAETMRADTAVGTPMPNSNQQQQSFINFNNGQSNGAMVMQMGTLKVFVNGSLVCSDNSTFAYNVYSGVCSGGGVSSSWINYTSGDYSITFTSPPVGYVNATWTELASWDVLNGGGTAASLEQVDFLGGPLRGMSDVWGDWAVGLKNFLGGPSASLFGYTDVAPFTTSGYAVGAIGYTQQIANMHSVQIPNRIPNAVAAPVLIASSWRGEGVHGITGGVAGVLGTQQWSQDVTVSSHFTGYISGAPTIPILTLTAGAVGPMWEGEVVGCNPYSISCPITLGTQIASLSSGTWGASGSTYNVIAPITPGSTTSGPSGVANYASSGSPATMLNEVNYADAPGSGGMAAYSLEPLNDISVQQSNGLSGIGARQTLPWSFFTGGRRFGTRAGALAAAELTNNSSAASDPTLSRTKPSGCDTSATYSPCLDIGNTYQAQASGAISGSTVTFTGGLSANARPFVPGMLLSCTSCTAGRVVVAVSAPPTQSTTSGAGQIGNTFTLTASGSMGVSTTETVTGGCAGTAGVGATCVDINFALNTTGATALATCGVNNLSGYPSIYPITASITSGVMSITSAPSPIGFGASITGAGVNNNTRTTTAFLNTTTGPINVTPLQTVGSETMYVSNYLPPYGTCQNAGIGDLVRSFRIGGNQQMGAGIAANGDFYDDGLDPITGSFNQNGAFTCNLVAATVVQCVTGPAYAEGLFFSRGFWPAQPWAKASISSATYTNSTGILSLTFASAPLGASVGTTLNGTDITVSGMTGTGSVASLNGTWTLTSTGSSGTVLNLGAPRGLTATITSATGTLAAGGTYISYGDAAISTGRFGSAGGNVGGQMFAFTAGLGGTDGTYALTATCTQLAQFSQAPVLDVTVSGGTIVDAYWSSETTTPSQGYGIGGTNTGGCTFSTAGISGLTGASITSPTYGPVEGQAGILSYVTDNNSMGTLLYDNSGINAGSASPFANAYYGTSGYWEPGLPVMPWGQAIGSQVSG